MNDATTRQDQDPGVGNEGSAAAEQRPVAEQRPAPGQRLAVRRQELGWTVEYVASRLNLAPRQIVAIESDNYAALPGMATTRGFVRAYAKLLTMDAAPLVSSLSAESTPLEDAIPLRRPLPAAPFVPAKLEPFGGGGKPWLLILLGVVLLVFVIGFVVQQFGLSGSLKDGVALRFDTGSSLSLAQNGNAGGDATAQGVTVPLARVEPSAGAGIAPAAAAVTDAQPSGVATAVVPLGAGTSNESGSAATGVASAAATGSPVNTSPTHAAASAATAAAAPAPATASASSAPSDSQRLLVLKAIQDCWIEIRKPDNTTLLMTTIPAGSTRELELGGPVNVVVGNAGGLQMTLRGRPVDLRSQARNNIARLELK